jgi:DNA-binding CsgD family transcriptional regulator/tetratricopeptide (TPR) repeat protein
MDEIFVGRQTELAFLRAKLDEVREGVSRVVLIDGAGGVGKTALLGEFPARAEHCRLLRASGEELEACLPYGVVEQLVADVGEPPPERLAAGADPMVAGAALVDMLGRLQAGGPVVVVIDDANWADWQSLQALVFALRRLRSDQVLALLSIRDSTADRLPASLHRLVAGETGARLRLSGLDAAELRMLSRALGSGTLSQRAAARLRDHTNGNPLYARALLDELSTGALQDNTRPLPAPRSFHVSVQARLASLPPDTQGLLTAAAVLGGHCPLKAAGRLAEVDDPLPALEHAIAARLLEERSTATELLVAFPHPLVHAAIYDDLGPARRATLHARAAQMVDGEAAILRHRVAAASGADARLATEIAALAGRQAAEGAWTPAADNLLAAARLSATRADQERFVLHAIEHLLLGGATSEAATLATELATFRDGVRRDYVLARLAMVAGRHADADDLLARAWKYETLATQPDLTAAVAEQLATSSLVRGRAEEAVTWARRAPAATGPDPTTASNLLDIQVIGLALSGRAPEALRLTSSLPDLDNGQELGGLDGWIGRGVGRLWTDDLAGARRDLTGALAAYRRRRAPLPWEIIGLVFLAETEYRLGSWDDAILHAERAVSISQETDNDWLAALVHAVATFPLAARGMREAAAAHADAAATHLEALGTESSAMWVAAAKALLALSEGDHQAVTTAIQPIRCQPRWARLDEPGVEPWPALHAEALVALGHCDEAESVLAPFEAAAAARTRRSSLGAAARARGALEAARRQPKPAEAAFRAGLEHLKSLRMPFDLGLLQAAYGRFLRRSGRRGNAVRYLETARTQFSQLNARPFLDRCDRELAACGRAPAKRTADPATSLTPQELAVARLVAAGRTNRQAAAELVVSVKTIEYHLGHAYAKLAVTSRTQLALALRQAWGGPDRGADHARDIRLYR